MGLEQAAGDTIAVINREILNPLILLLFGAAIVYFLWGLMVFIRNQDNEEAQGDGRRHMFWGVVGIFLMMAVGGILNVLTNLASQIR